MRKGPPFKIDDKAKAEIYACLTVGASLKDAADYLGVDNKTVYLARKNDPVFAKGVMQAVKKGKLHHLNKIGKATQWQASAWMLERKWGKEFGRREQIETKHSGSINQVHTIKPAMERLAANPDAYANAKALAERISNDN